MRRAGASLPGTSEGGRALRIMPLRVCVILPVFKVVPRFAPALVRREGMAA
ncbi:MAG: hypothetical protein NBV68_18750 [Erythrobacter sp.]|uniref:hypothetical protein n=1 Tax=Erythrobacter sp. TaxID=1042 RepID=UPI0025E72BC1|nr:hypothetical protein [Erythrobacter sp.]MCM0001416.1 hypothetical protein [Erythrobacter sp.]